jgi:hypothetical protein
MFDAPVILELLLALPNSIMLAPSVSYAQCAVIGPDRESMKPLTERARIALKMMLAGVDIDENRQGVMEILTHLVELSEVLERAVLRSLSLERKNCKVVLVDRRAALFSRDMKDDVGTLGHMMAPALLVFHLQDQPVLQDPASVKGFL